MSRARDEAAKKPFISVVIPAYNEEKYLPRCLASLDGQTYPRQRFEVIVVDNASTDRTAEIAREHGALVVQEGRKGVGRARQSGAEAAQGEIIAGTDADIEALPEWLERIAARFVGDPRLGGITGPVYFYDGNWFLRIWYRYVNTAWVWLLNAVGLNAFSGNNFAVHREPFQHSGGFRVELVGGEDTDLALRLRQVTKLAFAPEVVIYASARRGQENYLRILLRTVALYLRLWLFNRLPDGQPEVR
jgi:glycosyltransferase involved in cell wall biosynthesis